MPPAPTQENRDIAIETTLGSDVLLLKSFNYKETLGRPFSIEVEMLCVDHGVEPADLLGTNATIRVEQVGLPESQYFNGEWDRFEYHGVDGGYAKYTGRLVPWLSFLRHTSDCKIHQEKTALDIIKEVFRDFALGEFEESISGSFRERVYCVQYRETSLDFVSRLMEEEGIYYYFKHEDGKHTMVLCDDSSAHQAHDAFSELVYNDEDNWTRSEPNMVVGWHSSHEVRTTEYELRDYDYLKPSTLVDGSDQVSRSHERAEFQRYDYPGAFTESGDGGKLSTVRIQAIQAGHVRFRSESGAVNVSTGCSFSLKGHPRDAYNDQEYLVTGVDFTASSDRFEASKSVSEFYGAGGGGGAAERRMVFTAIPVAEQYRTPQTTPRPLVGGPQTAVVVGPSGEELYLDEHGRVQVKFHWDRYANGAENDSCWVRVSQGFAGKAWGGAFHPRIGQEVIVDFEEGNPDRPIITGRVYNGTNKYPYDPTSFGTISTVKSSSSKGGGGFNELRFEDKKGEEQIYIHAQKNIDILVLNDRFEKVENDRHLTVGNDKREKVMNNRHEVVEASHHEHIKKDRNVKIDKKEALEVGESRSVTVKKDVNQDFKKNYLTKVKNIAYTKAKTIVNKASFNITHKVGGNFVAITPAGIKIKGKAIQIESSSKAIDIKAKGDITMDATGKIEGKSKADIKLDAKGNGEVKSLGNMDIKATGNLTCEATANGTFKSTGMGEVSSSAILTVKGSLVKIN